jgi:hypothetical protein
MLSNQRNQIKILLRCKCHLINKILKILGIKNILIDHIIIRILFNLITSSPTGIIVDHIIRVDIIIILAITAILPEKIIDHFIIRILIILATPPRIIIDHIKIWILINSAINIGILIIPVTPLGIKTCFVVSYFYFIKFDLINTVLIFLLLKIIMEANLGIIKLLIKKITDKNFSSKQKSSI